MGIVLERLQSPTPEAAIVVAELDADLAGEGYDPSQHHGYTLEKIFVPSLHFYLAHANGALAGCGGVQFFDGFAELKRMYVRPEFRGAGVARALISRLEDDARTHGSRVVRLETGNKQSAAMRFYAREGYAKCPAFTPYTELAPFAVATSVFMEKRL